MLNHVKDAMCVLMGSRAHKMTIMAASVGSALLYGLTSTSMAFLNKIVLDVYGFNYPLIIMTIQVAVTFIAVKVLDRLKFIKLSPLTRTNLRQFSAPCFFYTLNGVLSLAALGQMNLTMYSMVKRNGPLVTMLLASVFLKKGFPGRSVIMGVLLMSIGCIIAANGDIKFDLMSYTFGAGSVLSQSTYLILLQKLSDNFAISDTLYMNSVMSFPVLAVLAGLTGEYDTAYYYDRYGEGSFMVLLFLLFFMGSFLNFSLFLCNSNNSALTTSVVGTLKSVVQTTMGFVSFGGVSLNAAMLTGVGMNLSGGIVYTYAKYLEVEKAKELKRSLSLLTVDDVERGRDKDQNDNQQQISEALISLYHSEEQANSDERIL